MKIRFEKNLVLAILLVCSVSSLFADSDPAVFRVPKVEGLTVDGVGSDWGSRGFRVEILTGPDGKALPAEDFDVRFRLAWDEQGLYVLAAVQDDPDFTTTFHPVSAEGISVSVKLPTLEQILERYVMAVGGKDAVAKLTTRVCKGRFEDDRPYAGPKQVIPFETFSKIPDKSLIIMKHPGNTEQEGFNGSIRWRLDSNGLIRRMNQERSQLDYFLDPQNALRIREYFPGMELMGTVKLRGHSVYVVENSRKSPHYTLYFDAETGLLIQIGYYELHEYRDVDGVKHPFRLEYSRKGGSNTYIFDEVRHNVPVEDTRFALPKKRLWICSPA